MPKMIDVNTDNRIFTDIYANDDSVLFYAPIRVYSISPACGPSKGGTTISITGTGFVGSDKLRVRFTYGDLSQEAHCYYDEKSQTLMCSTPKFEEFDGEKHPSVQLPCDCYLSVTMDGVNYSECEMPFKIFSNEISLTSIAPKSGSVIGGSEVVLSINLDDVTAGSIQNLTVGFQPKPKKAKGAADELGKTSKMSQQDGTSSNQRTGNTGNPQANVTAGFDDYNKQSLNNTGFNNELNNFICSPGVYENGKITCKVPALDTTKFDADYLFFNVDVALNGQQFTEKPVQFRYYDIHIKEIKPAYSTSDGGALINIYGKGLYDSQIKKVKFSCGGGDREVSADWDKKQRCLKCIVPPLTWLFGGEEVEEEKLLEMKASPIQMQITFNNQEWIPATNFNYHDHTVTRIAYAHTFMGDAPEPEQREADWNAELPEEEYPEEMTEDERKKKDDEKEAVAVQETEESTVMSKRKGYRIFIHGTGFKKSDSLIAKFNWDDKCSQSSQVVFKNEHMLASCIPDMGADVPEGDHLIAVTISLNGQQFNTQQVQFLFKSVDPNLTEEELKKMDEEDAKGAKKPGGKKK